MIHEKKRILIIFNQWRSIINLGSPPPHTTPHHQSSPPAPGLLSFRPKLPFTLYSIFLSHCSTLHAPSELHYFSHSVVKGEGQQPEKNIICYNVKSNKNVSQPWQKVWGCACILGHKLQTEACTLSHFVLSYLHTHTLFLSFTHTHTHTVTLWALPGSLNEKEKSFIRLIFAAPRSTF